METRHQSLAHVSYAIHSTQNIYYQCFVCYFRYYESYRFLLESQFVNHLLIIEGQASNDGYTGNFDLSYQRALSLYRYFQINRHLDLKRQNCEVLVCGSGTEGALRAYPDNASNTKNQRFLIHILPKPGIIN